MTTARQALDAACTEEQLQDAIMAEARVRGWLVHAERPARTKDGWRTPIQGDAGFPDLVLVRAGRVLFIECKSMRGRTTEEQRAWLTALAQQPIGGVECYLLRPSDRDWFVEVLK